MVLLCFLDGVIREVREREREKVGRGVINGATLWDVRHEQEWKVNCLMFVVILLWWLTARKSCKSK